jgi:hypothetical protein
MGAPVYVYGVLAARQTASCMATLGAGIGARSVGVLLADDLVALVSEALSDTIARSRRHMLDHTSVLERAMQHATVLPLRFGTIAPSEAELRMCITANRTAFRNELRSIEGRVELGLKASWRKESIFADIVERDQALRQMRDRLQTRPAGETYYERIELGRRVEAALAGRRDAEQAAILAELTPLAERHESLRTHDEDMILNHAFLLPRATEPAFDAAVARLAERCGNRLELRYVGPVPPFNFVTLRAGWLTDRATVPAGARQGAA